MVDSSLTMASASSSVDIQKLNGQFELSCTVNYLINLGRFILNNLENTFNFSSELGLLNRRRKCDHCRRVFIMISVASVSKFTQKGWEDGEGREVERKVGRKGR